MRKGQAQQAFLYALHRLTEQKRNVSHSPQARDYAPKLMASEGIVTSFSRRELEIAMHDLLNSSRIRCNEEMPWRGADRRSPLGLARVTGATAEAHA